MTDAVTVHPASLVWHAAAGLVPFQLPLPRLAPRLHLGTVQQCCPGGDPSEHPVMHWQVLSGHAVLRMSQTDGQHTRTVAARRGALQVHIWVTCLTWEASTGCLEVPHNGLSGKHSWLRAVPAAQTRLLPCCQCPCPFPTATWEVARNSESAWRSHLGPPGLARTGT